MRKLTLEDLLSIEDYSHQRTSFRKIAMEHKNDRRLQIGPNLMMHFEDFTLMRYQILELTRAEKITSKDDLLEELSAYNPLIPDGKNLKVTLMLEFPDEYERRIKLSELLDIENKISIQLENMDPVFPICNEDLERSTEDKTSAVHFMRFEFTDEMINAAKDGAKWTVKCSHKCYEHEVSPLPENIRSSLTSDFS
ncbi:MAG: DUF3501 family protein [Gammaproteobacteria bacterium]|nr:DUF3501 family protein [Gammaproteobacteria bacterium]MDB2444535.1 DUF3501 family protein [Gammaproteobacteria bacterium]MDG0998820.1 DUF3501 family protein [Gammaproteobacteria bacterium]